MNVFKFKKYKEGYEDKKNRVLPRGTHLKLEPSLRIRAENSPKAVSSLLPEHFLGRSVQFFYTIGDESFANRSHD